MNSAARLGPLKSEQIRAALDRFGLGVLIGVSPVPAGLGGQNVFVESTAGDFVLRGNELFPGEAGHIALERERTDSNRCGSGLRLEMKRWMASLA